MKHLTIILSLLIFTFTAKAQIIIGPVGPICATPIGDDPSADRWFDCNANIVTPTNFKNFKKGKVGIGEQYPETKLHVYTQETDPGGLNFGIRSEATGKGSNYALQGFSSGTQNGLGIGVMTNVQGDGTANFGVDIVVSGAPGGWIGAASWGVDAQVLGSAPTKYGVYGNAVGPGNVNYGIFGQAAGATTNWAGYFLGSVFATTYVTSDRKLKSGIENYSGGLAQINRLGVKSYNYRTQEYPSLQLPEGDQIGLIAQELEAEMPGLVKDALHYTNLDEENQTGEEVSFKTVNYEGLIPVLVSAVQELDQQNRMLADEIARLQQEISSTNREGVASQSAYLYANMPNPFNEQTIINYFLPESAENGTLHVFDINGKMVRSYNLSSGEGQVTFEARELAAGMYLYSLSANGKQLSARQMVISE